jgi:hypothetical protein
MSQEGKFSLGAGARRLRFWTRLIALVLAGVSLALGGGHGLAGALLGGLLVEANLSLLVLTLDRAPQWSGQSLQGTLTRFYLSFAATALVCFLVIRFHWGHPLAFLAVLLAPVPGLALALISLTVSPPKARPDHDR